jgi:hypothetical protein
VGLSPPERNSACSARSPSPAAALELGDDEVLAIGCLTVAVTAATFVL